mgnify:CR=1 FL=1
MIPAPTALELSAPVMKKLLEQVTEKIIHHIETLPQQPAADTTGGAELAKKLSEQWPTTGHSFEELLELLFEEAVPKSFNAAGPSYLAYIPGGGLFHAALGDLIANACNRYTGVWAAAPALVQLEVNVIRWFCELVGYPKQSLGFLTSGGSLATLSAVTTARCERLPENFLNGVVYTSDQSHHSVKKAAFLAGFPQKHIREIPSDDYFRICTQTLQKQIQQDRDAGLQPFLIVGNAGTTNTGAVDDLHALADLSQREDMWLHVDAAYGGFFMLTDHGRKKLSGLERADSITLDPHKGLFLPYGTGALIVRDGNTLKRTHSMDADYLPMMQEDFERVDFCAISPELSRDYRGLRVWLPLKLHGFEVFAEYLEEKLQLAQWITQKLREIENIEIVAEPELSLLAFRLRQPDWSQEESNRKNLQFLERINAKQRVWLTGTYLDGHFVIRICVLCFRTHFERMQSALEDILSALEA